MEVTVGKRWRAQSCDDGQFDELVIDHFLHLEAMDRNGYFLEIGKRRFWFTVKRNGDVVFTYEETDK